MPVTSPDVLTVPVLNSCADRAANLLTELASLMGDLRPDPREPGHVCLTREAMSHLVSASDCFREAAADLLFRAGR